MDHERMKNAVLGSLKLSTSGKHHEALQLMDDIIAEAMREGEELWAFTFIDHAALLNGVKRDGSLLRHYYEQYLTYAPENPRALYGLADVAMENGQTEIAKQYAKRCYLAMLLGKDEVAKKDLLDLVLERWPEVAQ